MALPYLLIRDLHIASVTLSITLFVLRGGCGPGGVDWPRPRPGPRRVPHPEDSLPRPPPPTPGGGPPRARLPGQGRPGLAGMLQLVVGHVGAGRAGLRPGQLRGRDAAGGRQALATVGSMVALAVTRWGS